MKKPEKIALALGSNLGDRRPALRAAIAGFAPYVNVNAVSPVYETAPVYVTDQPAFLNAVVTGETALEPLAFMLALKDLEKELGRQPSFHYGPRLIDIDIIFYGDLIVQTPELTVPHPRLAEREFVLRPLADIAPDWKHPQNFRTVAQMLGDIVDSQAHCLGPL